MKPELYVSVDIEADGPIPGQNSMLSIGAAAFIRSDASPALPHKMLGTFSANLHQLPDAVEDTDTMDWWAKHQDAWRACREDVQFPRDAMRKFVEWIVDTANGVYKPVFVGYPASYDFLFVYWYVMRFYGISPFSFSALDIKTMAMTMLDTPFHATWKKVMPKRWFSEKPHTHVAVDDAIEEGEMFMKMLDELRAHGGFAS